MTIKNRSVSVTTLGDTVAIDGKTLRRSHKMLFLWPRAVLTWSSKFTRLVKPLFSLPTISLQIDSDSHNQNMNASDYGYHHRGKLGCQA